MKASLLDGKELQKGNKYAEVKDKQINFYKVLDFSVSKPGKHGSSKKLVKSTNLRNGRNNESIFGGGINVYAIDDFEFILKPIYMVNSDFTEFCTDLETEEYLYISTFDLVGQELIKYFRQKNISKSADDLLTDQDGNRLCLLMNECNLDENTGTFLWDIVYVPESDLEKKVQPGTLFDEFIAKGG
ncbi:hypothetical protein EHP00_1319 [Ecytonucleospora hepatopenaei]|uniref:Translation initiation factor IF-5A n=1 Tax=Ecytonucleospora hepatopenaei TaxID=646526 RepID=A0A1W0E5D3_9MICR|nr:hypothetical protein EHP00_1319 [Ecytonucleospora hepatopenaei]